MQLILYEGWRIALAAADAGVRFAGRPLQLARYEYLLLTHLAAELERVFTMREPPARHLGYRTEARTRTLDARACRLRKKLERAGAVGFVVNRRGVGYRLVDRVPAVIDQGQVGRRARTARAPWLSCTEPGVRRRRAGLRRTAAPNRRSPLRRSARLVRRTPLRRARVSPASDAQRAKVLGQGCLVCGRRPADPAHLVPRSLGGCDQPDCVVPLGREHHRRYDCGQLDPLPYLEPRYRSELQHGLGHLGLLGLLRRVTGSRWTPIADGSDDARRAA